VLLGTPLQPSTCCLSIVHQAIAVQSHHMCADCPPFCPSADLAPPVLRSVSAAPAPSAALRLSTAPSSPPPIARAKSAAAAAAGGPHSTLADISSGRALWQDGGGGAEGGRQGLQTRHTSSSLDSEDLPPEGEWEHCHVAMLQWHCCTLTGTHAMQHVQQAMRHREQRLKGCSCFSPSASRWPTPPL
jgi:hypothetical protein